MKKPLCCRFGQGMEFRMRRICSQMVGSSAMKLKNLGFNLAAVGAIAMVSLTSAPTSADAAFVLNSGRDGLECSGDIQGPLVGYIGHASVVTTSSGQINLVCNGEITGEPPETTLVLVDQPGPPAFPTTTCKVVITKSGRFNASCHN